MRKTDLLQTARIIAYPALIGSVSSVVMEVHMVPLSVFGLALLAGLFLDRRSSQKPIIPLFILLPLLIAGIVISVAALKEDNIFNRALGILLLIISAKLVSPKNRRDMLQIYLLNFFLVTGSAVTRLDMEFALLVLGEAFITIFALLLIHGSDEQNEVPRFQVWKLAKWSMVITLFLIPATTIIFLIIPRPTMTLFAWGGSTAARTGFSDTVKPGEVSDIKVDTSPAFRVKWIEGRRPEKAFWRGIVYDNYNMGTWERTERREIIPPKMTAESVEYELLLEPAESRYLLTLGLPYEIEPMRRRTRIVTGYTAETGRTDANRAIYGIRSYLLGNLPSDTPPEYYLGVPDSMHDYLVSFSSGLIQDTDLNTAKRLEAFLRSGFSYDLHPGEPTGEPVLYFLSTSKKGHCEYFASAMALLLRANGIPARVVGGYLEGEWNELGQYYLVRQSDAHTWVEAWIEERGWVTFDPTPGGNSIVRSESDFYRMIDVLRMKWYYWVLDYNISRQIELARKSSEVINSLHYGGAGLNLKGKTPFLKYLLLGLIIPFLIIIYRVTVRYIQERPRTYVQRFVSLLKRHGYEKRQGDTILEFGREVVSEDPNIEKSITGFVEEYYKAEYDPEASGIDLSQRLKEVKQGLTQKTRHVA